MIASGAALFTPDFSNTTLSSLLFQTCSFLPRHDRHEACSPEASAMLMAGMLPYRTVMMLFALALSLLLSKTKATSSPRHASTLFDRSVPRSLFFELEELSRLVAISYCVGNAGIQEPFECLNHCSDFKGFALVTVQILSTNQHHIISANSV